jgi:hypothetical protein
MKNLTLSVIFICSLHLASAQWYPLTIDFTPNIAVTAFDSVIIGGSPFPWSAFDLAVSYDFGQTWAGHNLPSQNGVSYLSSCDSMIYACTPTGIYRTAKNQMNWLPFSEGLQGNNFKKICITDSIILSISNSKVFKRVAGDTAWTTIVETSPVEYIDDIDCNGSLIALAGENGIAESYDWGQNWTLWPPNYIHDWDVLTIKGDTLIVAGRAGIYRKLLTSGNIAKVSNGLDGLWSPHPPDYFGYFYAFHQTGGRVFVSGETGVYLLSNESWTWIKVPGTSADALTNNQELLIVAAGYGGLRAKPLAELTATRPALLPSSISVYPNPADEFLVVETQGAQAANLSIFNLNGSIIMQHSLSLNITNLNISHLPQGMYFLKIESESDVRVMKFMKR